MYGTCYESSARHLFFFSYCIDFISPQHCCDLELFMYDEDEDDDGDD